MYRFLRFFGLSLIAALIGTGAATAAQEKPPATAKPLPADQLVALYSGKTWVWDKGAGYFAPDRKFLAWTGSGAKTYYAEGRWTVSKSGVVCMVAVWHDRWSGFPSSKCFKHVVADGNIYQLRPAGAGWYIFEHSPVQQYDEVKKLVAGDQVTDTYEKARLFVHRKSLAIVPPNLAEFVK